METQDIEESSSESGNETLEVKYHVTESREKTRLTIRLPVKPSIPSHASKKRSHGEVGSDVSEGELERRPLKSLVGIQYFSRSIITTSLMTKS